MIQLQEEAEAWQEERKEFEAKQASLTQELEQLRKAFEEHKQTSESKGRNQDDSMTTSQR